MSAERQRSQPRLGAVLLVRKAMLLKHEVMSGDHEVMIGKQ